MQSKLAEALINKGFLIKGTEVQARYLSSGLAGTNTVEVQDEFTINRAFKLGDDTVSFELISNRDGNKIKVFAESITAIDGMDPTRFASVYNVEANGSNTKLGKRRGRKPKDRSKIN